ncbi:MAG: fatty acid desaturase [Pseudomonadota bacterium]
MNGATNSAKPSNTRGLVHLTGHLLLLVTTGTLIALSSGSFWVLPAMVVHGAVLVFLFAPLHECVHRTAFRSVWLNNGVAWFCGLAVGLPPNAFRAFHFAHHRHTQIPGKDPELDEKAVETWPDYLIYLSGWRYWTSEAALLFAHARGQVTSPYYPDRLKPRLVREARIMLAVYAGVIALSLALWSTAALAFWLLPVLLGQPFLRAYLMAEHTGLPFVENMWENTRTTLTFSPVRFLAWNMPFHAEHHAQPAVPFHGLPALHQAEGRARAHITEGYSTFHQEHVAGFSNGPHKVPPV